MLANIKNICCAFALIELKIYPFYKKEVFAHKRYTKKEGLCNVNF